MFALQNFSLLLSNVPQFPTLAKYGLFQSSSFSTIKKFREVDVVCNELPQKVHLMKDINYEKFINFLTGLKFDSNLNSPEWPSLENLPYGNTRRRKDSDVLHNKFIGAVSPGLPVNDSSKMSELISNKDSRDYSCKTSALNSNSGINNSSDESELQLNYSQNINDECIKPSLIISHLMSLKNVKYQNVFKSNSVYASLGRVYEINGDDRRHVQGGRRGFKTQRQVKLELEESFFHKLANLFLDRKSTVKSAETLRKYEALKKEEAVDSKTLDSRMGDKVSNKLGINNGLIRHLIDVLRLIFYGGLLYLFFELYGASNPKKFTSHISSRVNVKFDDAKGMDEAKAELQCVVEFLRNPSRFTYLGGKLPSGILLQGPPGTGKTLLARAVAGEAGVEFFHMSGSEFDEVLVGEGARRVRTLFRAARQKAPAVIFIDEIDAIGGKRVNSSTHPFANQTIIQLLAEMDGFIQNDRIVVIGATNRASDLDEALLRPGRFDLKIQLRRPDVKGRIEILKLHLSKITCRDIDINYIAKRTVGFTGADLKNLVNQAALSAATFGHKYVTTQHLDRAIEKILLGPALKSLVRTEQMNLISAYHESGHAIVAYFTPGSSPPIKATILPHGFALGHTATLPEEKYNHSKAELLASIDVKLGGRAAEELIFGADNVTTGCQNDLFSATEIATKMVREWGMSDKVGLRTHERKSLVDYPQGIEGQAANDEIDEEIKQIIQESYERAKKILKEHAKEHKLLAEKLLEKETLQAEEIKEIIDQGGLSKDEISN